MKFQQLFQLPSEEDENTTFQEITEGIAFRGYNLWLLVFAMVIACVGLNTNNVAAVIGAMLISPLMGPVIGLAFGLGIHHNKIIKSSLYNWGLMIIISVISSSIYFLITPFNHSTEQLQNFSQGTIFDVLLAFFGGLAGFIGIIRKEAAKVIAGVAVATACMPPLCTAGYGLASLQWDYFFGGLYFYFINCFFIGLGTWILTLLLGYREQFLKKTNTQSNQLNIWLIVITFVVLSPSVYITLKKWNYQKLQYQASDYITEIQHEIPQLLIVNHEIVNDKKNHSYLSISLLNDSLSISKEELLKANDLQKDIEVKWHFAPRPTSEIERLQKKLEKLEQKVKALEQTK